MQLRPHSGPSETLRGGPHHPHLLSISEPVRIRPQPHYGHHRDTADHKTAASLLSWESSVEPEGARAPEPGQAGSSQGPAMHQLVTNSSPVTQPFSTPTTEDQRTDKQKGKTMHATNCTGF